MPLSSLPRTLAPALLALALALSAPACSSDDAPESPGAGGAAGSSAAAGSAGAAGAGAASGTSGSAGAAGTPGETCNAPAASGCKDTGCTFVPSTIDCNAAVDHLLSTLCGDDSPCGKCKDASDRDFLVQTCESERSNGGEDNAMWGCNAASTACDARLACFSMHCEK